MFIIYRSFLCAIISCLILVDPSLQFPGVLSSSRVSKCVSTGTPLKLKIKEIIHLSYGYEINLQRRLMKTGICNVDVTLVNKDSKERKIYIDFENDIQMTSGVNYLTVHEPITDKKDDWSAENLLEMWSCKGDCSSHSCFFSHSDRIRIGLHVGDLSTYFELNLHVINMAIVKYGISTLTISATHGYLKGNLLESQWNSTNEFQVLEGTQEVKAPPDHVIMMSVLTLPPEVKNVHVYSGDNIEASNRVQNFRGVTAGGTPAGAEPIVIEDRSARVRILALPAYGSVCMDNAQCVNVSLIYFSFHQTRAKPALTPQSLWNCSVPWFREFQQHLQLCDLVTECYAGEDEDDCGYDTCSPHGFSAAGRCFLLLRARTLTHAEAMEACAAVDSRLAVLSTEAKWTGVTSLFKKFPIRYRVSIGLTSVGSSFPVMYAMAHQWFDDSMFFMPIENRDNPGDSKSQAVAAKCAWGKFYADQDQLQMYTRICSHTLLAAYPFCELDLPSKSPFTIPPLGSVSLSDVELVRCPDDHQTYPFLACDILTQCYATGSGEYGTIRESWDIPSPSACTWNVTSLPPSFACRQGRYRVPYSLVCDHQPDCQDKSDEEFCQFPPCPQSSHTMCDNKQCIPRENWCDTGLHCFDGSDEESCQYIQETAFAMTQNISNGEENFTNSWQQVIDFSSLNEPLASKPEVVFPDTHFQCPGLDIYLAIYFLCNGVIDCPGHEDEENCNTYACPGFYRCRGSKVCLHPVSLCDGVPQCPRFDDEQFCGVKCPRRSCRCYGHAFTCPASFKAQFFPHLRYLNAEKSGMTPSMLHNNPLLIHLSLSRCGLQTADSLNLRNLRSLDLSVNQLKTISSSLLTNSRLSVFFLSDNPLVSAFVSPHHSKAPTPSVNVHTLDLSLVPINHLDLRILTPFSSLLTLNLSHCSISRVTHDFRELKQLKMLNLKGNPLDHFPRTLLKFSTKLQKVMADTFRMCCEAVLPSGFNVNECQAPNDDLATCHSLLGSSVHFNIPAAYAVLALLGNMAVFIVHALWKRSGRLSSYSVLLSHLSLSDFMGGLYLVIILAAERVYRGRYLWAYTAWRYSVGCQIAGIFSTLSCQASIFFLVLLTADRVLALWRPPVHASLSRKAVHVTCAGAWTLGLLLAAAPSLFPASVSASYSHFSICTLLPKMEKGSILASPYVTGVVGVMPLSLLCLLGLGQGYIYFKIKSNPRYFLDGSPISADIDVARRLFPMCVTNCMYRLAMTSTHLLSVWSLTLTPSTFLNLVMFLTPLASVLDPLLYAHGVFRERKRFVRQQRLIQRLRAKRREVM